MKLPRRLTPASLMQHKSLLSITMVILAFLVLLTWLYGMATAASPHLHFEYTKALRDLRQADAEINSEIFANRLEVTRNYDRLTLYTEKAQAAAARVAHVPNFLHQDDRLKVQAKAAELQLALNHKVQLADNFKRKNSVLRNSLAYFPAAADQLVNQKTWHGQLRGEVETYSRHVLAFARDPSSERKSRLETARQQLTPGQTPAASTPLGNLIVHGDVIASLLPEVNGMIQGARKTLPPGQIEELNRLYASGHEHAEATAAQYRKMLFVVALILTAYLAFTFIRLDRTRQSLVRAHAEVSDRYAAQLLAEDRLRLHATAFHNSHDGIVLADANGNILDVNPAFTRITGYERSEVLGRNPRVIKSGRHDQAFYAAMWKSILGNGSWQGEIWNKNKYGEIYPELLSIAAVRSAQGELTNFVAVFADIRRLKEQEKQLTQMAYYDALTGLPNRVLLSDRLSQGLSQSRRTGTKLAVCYLDLDGFKPVNDTYGHETGDQLLIEMAQRLKGGMRGGDTVARLGGDEFVMLLLGLDGEAECEQAVQRILESVILPISVEDKQLSVSASIGVTLFPQDDSDPDTLLRHADQAMYQAKQAGKNRHYLFDPTLDQQVRSQHDQISRIELALINREFELYYQPKVNMREGRVVGAEALIRWNHPERGLVPPIEFLPLIEEHSLSIKLGEWVIENALQQLATWLDAELDISVSVNIAGLHLQSPGFVQHLTSLLANSPQLARRFELEILETSALEDMINVSGVIQQCRELGVTFSLDDFGTGYSSLTYLKRLPISTIKIDQSFVRESLSDPNNLVIVQGVVGLATAFQRMIIAEGVETAEQGKLLMQLGCDHAQGYGISKPMPAGAFTHWAEKWKPAAEWASIRHLKWNAADGAMLVAKVEFSHWIEQIIFSLNEGHPLPHRCIEDYQRCGFGLWYYGEAQNLYRHLDNFAKLEEPHKLSHHFACIIDDHWRNGQKDEARALSQQLLTERDAVIASMVRLEMAVAQQSADKH